jgi:hypothetical protein
MDVRVVEARKHTAAAQIDAIGAGERGLVRPDAARDAVAGDRESAGDRELWRHCPHDAVLEDHLRNLFGASTVDRTMNTIVILLLLVVMLALATFWPTSD